MNKHYETRVGLQAIRRRAQRRTTVSIVAVLLVIAMFFSVVPFTGFAQAAESAVSGQTELIAADTEPMATPVPAEQPTATPTPAPQPAATEEPAATEAPAETAQQPELTALTAENDQAYVSAIEIKKIEDGKAPFDGEDVTGGDTGDNNKLVRASDSITYTLAVSMAANDGVSQFNAARVRMEIVLPMTAEQAEFDTDAMTWMDETDGYKWAVTKETRKINGIDTECQVLTCYAYINGNSAAVVPGEFTEPVIIKVNEAQAGVGIAPQFSAAMECSQQKIQTITADAVTVVAPEAATEEQARAEAPAPEEEPFAAESGEAEGFPALMAENDQAYVTGVTITNIVDGTAPFDTESKAGNDVSASDKIVRSFDSVSYMVKVGMAAIEGFGPFGAARVRMEFVLPVTSDIAEFDTSAMGWMDTSEGYMWTVTNETRDGVQCQVLNCYNYLYNEQDTVVPGEFSQPVIVKVNAARNGQIIQPQFTAGMECCSWEEVFCEEHNQQEKWTAIADPVVVTAAPKYNVSLIAGRAQANWAGINNYNTGNASGEFPAANYGIGNVMGRNLSYGVTVMLYNDNASKGLKGIELPTGDITFDLTVSSTYNPDAAGEPDVNVTSEYTPLLWSYGPNRPDISTPDGRRASTGVYPYAYLAAPLSTGTNTASCTTNSGHIHATQDSTTGTISITISDYVIDTSKFPTNLAGSPNPSENYGQAHIGMFAAGELYIQQPFNKNESTNTSSTYDIVSEYGNGTFSLTVSDVNLSMRSVTGQTQDAQMKQDDDDPKQTVYLTVPGRYDNIVYYTSTSNTALETTGVNSDAEAGNGTDSVVAGAEIMLVSGFTYEANMEEVNRAQYATSLMKFDASAIELQGDTYTADIYASQPTDVDWTYKYLYAAKADGTNWIDDNELRNADVDDLVYYSSLDAIPDGHLCVATLTVFEGPANMIAAFTSKVGYSAKVKNDQSLVNDVLMLHSISRLWTSADLLNAGVTIDSIKGKDWTDAETSLADFPQYNFYKNNDYTKESYDASGAMGKHTGLNNHGDSLLVVGYKTIITKGLLQKTASGTTKDVFNMDQNQRTADFVLNPRTSYDQTGQTGSLYGTIVVEDTLPQHLKFIPGSAYVGGDYTPAAEGRQGTVTGGVMTPPSELRNNADGTQTLIWRFPDTEIGAAMQPIRYSVSIGTPGQEETDVPIATTSLVNKVRIYSADDMREPSIANQNYAEVGLRVVRGSATSFAKFTTTPLVDPDGIAKFTVLYANNSSNPETDIVLMDSMPYNEDPTNADPNASTFFGTYKVADWQLEIAKAPTSTLELYYTTDVSYRGKTAADVTYAEVTGTWTKADIAADGTATAMNGQMPVAWAVTGRLAGSETVRANIDLQLECEGSMANAMIINRWSTGQDTTNTRISIVSHSIEGLAWMDKNMDGQQGSVDIDEETRIPGVKVTLLQLKDGGDANNIADYEEIASTTTGNTFDVEKGEEEEYPNSKWGGRYRFTGLPDGTFMVRFDNGGTKIADYTATGANAGEDAADSDGIASYNASTGLLAQTVITGIVLPEAKDMVRAVYESRYNDSGFYDSGAISYTFTKIAGTDTTAALAGAEFAVYKSTHVHDEDCGGLSVDGTCSFIEEMMEGNIFDESVWDTTTPVCTATSGEDGKVTLTGLTNGVYMLVETSAPEGYALSNGCWILDVDPADEANPVTISGSAISPTAAEGKPNAFIAGEDGYYLPNYKKVEFPVTGGMGTILFTGGGIALIGIAVLVLILSSRKNRKQRGKHAKGGANTAAQH